MKAIANLLLCLTLLFSCGCITTKPPVTPEASRYNSFRNTWAATLAVYDYSKDLQVAGEITAKDAADIDRAWNAFRSGFRIALANAGGDDLVTTPESVHKLAEDLKILIYSTQ